ncbi:hypothetical protein ACFL1G_02435 [Planctomycetota bacterium]
MVHFDTSRSFAQQEIDTLATMTTAIAHRLHTTLTAAKVAIRPTYPTATIRTICLQNSRRPAGRRQLQRSGFW